MVTAPDLGTVVTCDEEPLASFVPLADLVGRGEAVGDGELDRIAAEVTPADVGLILYTSGTTAAPKACEITHQAFIQSWIAFADWLKLDETASLWSPGPMFHVSGTGPMVISLVSGAPALLMSHFDPTAAWRMIAHFRPALLFPSFPAVTAPLFQAAEYDRAASTYIKAVCNVAPPDTQRAIQAMLPEGTALISAFGMTEAVGSVATGRPEDPLEERLSGCGRPLPGIEVNIVDPERGTPCPAGEVGEIRFRGPSIFRGYYNDPAATAAAIDSDGWMASGDLGFVDHSGVIHYVGRIKDMLKVGGENVAPAEVEDVLSGHRAVGLVQVIGKPDSKYGEVPVAFVELRPGAVADPQELIEYCRDKLASFKVPREVRMIEDWPVSATKIQKFKLKELL